MSQCHVMQQEALSEADATPQLAINQLEVTKLWSAQLTGRKPEARQMQRL